MTGPLADTAGGYPVRASRLVHRGIVWDLRSDDVQLPHGEQVTREWVDHTGAVGVVALDDDERVLLVHQYRHPVRAVLWEVPAGLLDVPGEAAQRTAARELWEEAHHTARDWWVLADYFTSPGGSDEAVRIYLARGLTAVPDADRHVGDGEERHMPTRWVPLDEAVEAIMGGRLQNPTTVVGVLAAATARGQGWRHLRPADAPWPQRPRGPRAVPGGA